MNLGKVYKKKFIIFYKFIMSQPPIYFYKFIMSQPRIEQMTVVC